LWGRRFLVRTDHYSLKFLLDQRLSTMPQHQWLSKLFGFDFTVEYRPGRLNSAADALSRCDEETAALCSLSGTSFDLYADIRRATTADPVTCDLLQQLQAASLGVPWAADDGFLLHGKRIYVPATDDLRHQMVTLAHSAGHEGVQKTLVRLRADFYIPGDRQLVLDFVRSYDVCQRNKTPTTQPAGLLQPLDVPSQVWADISMDFIEGLPKVHDKSFVLTVVDRFSKYAHFIALSHPYTVASVTRAFFNGIVRLHGFPSSIVSDREPVFTSNLWRDLFKCAGVKQRLSTTFHPQTDGQSEVVNKVIAMYLCCATGDRPRSWVDWLSWAEYCYNTSYHTALRASPFEVVYGRPPHPSCHTTPGRPKQKRWTPCCGTATRSWRRFASVFFRPSSTPSATMMSTIARWSSTRAHGCCSDFSTDPPMRSLRRPRASCAHATRGRSRSSSASGRWLIVSDSLRTRACMTSSMWGC
jgi:hypothetical protein